MAISTGTPGTISSGTINQLPDWYTNYAKTVTNIGQGIAESLPGYNGYVDASGNPAPVVAGLSGTQQKGLGTLNDTVGAWKGGLSQAGNTVNSGIGAVKDAMGTVNGATGSFNSATGATNQAMGTIGTGLGQIGAATGSIDKMGGALDKAGSYLDPAAGYIANGANGSEFSADKMAQYTNPYTKGVNEEIARLGNQNLMENVLPGVNSTFTGAGQFGSTRNGEFNARAIRDSNASVLGQQSKVLMDAQSQALEQAKAASDRNLQAGQQTGALSNTAQGVAAGYGNAAGTQINQGSATLNGAAGQLGAAGQYNATGNNIVNQGQAQGQLGSQLGALSQIQASQAQAGQQMGLNDAQAQLTAGTLEQSTNQKGLDAAKADFMDRRDYPLQAIGGLSQVLPGVSGKVTPNQQTTQVNATVGTDPLQAWSTLFSGLGS